VDGCRDDGRRHLLRPLGGAPRRSYPPHSAIAGTIPASR
jgi:hypothetical protein